MYANIAYKRKYTDKTTFVLDNGKELLEATAIKHIKSKEIINATVVNINGKEHIRGTTAFKVQIIPTKYRKILVKPLITDVEIVNNITFDFERDVYKELLKWHNLQNRLALILKGPRQVGKTYLLKKFAKENYKQVIYIDLRDRNSSFLSVYNGLGKQGIYSSTDKDKKLFWLNVFKHYDQAFIDSSDTLIIIDEIQENSEIYSSIRDIRRSLNARLATTGSYLGIAEMSKDYWISAGDYISLELNSLSYVEFLKALDLYETYSRINSIDFNTLSQLEKDIYAGVEKAYNDYLTIGGYPAVVEEYIKSKGDLSACILQAGNLLESFSMESRRYFKDIIEDKMWDNVLMLVVQELIKRSNSLNSTSQDLAIRDHEKNKSLSANRKEINNVLSWLCKCNIVGQCDMYRDFKKLEITTTSRYYIKDMGIFNYICTQMPTLQKSDILGIRAENFVYLYLLTQVTTLLRSANLFKENIPYYAKQDNYEIDFLMTSLKDKRVALEVKNDSGATVSSNYALSNKFIDVLVKIQNTYGGVINNSKLVLPLFAIDKLERLL